MGDRKGELSEGCGYLVMLAALAVLIIAYALVTGAAEAMGEGTVFESPVFESPVFESPLGEGVIRAQVLGYEYMLPVVVVGGGES
jgi:hypothetical protein